MRRREVRDVARLLQIYRRCLARYEAAGDGPRAAIERRLIARLEDEAGS